MIGPSWQDFASTRRSTGGTGVLIGRHLRTYKTPSSSAPAWRNLFVLELLRYSTFPITFNCPSLLPTDDIDASACSLLRSELLHCIAVISGNMERKLADVKHRYKHHHHNCVCTATRFRRGQCAFISLRWQPTDSCNGSWPSGDGLPFIISIMKILSISHPSFQKQKEPWRMMRKWTLIISSDWASLAPQSENGPSTNTSNSP